MKKILVPALLAACTAVPAMAQSSIEALQLSQTELRGTARFMGMGGAFTALGGDLSTLTQNPAGVGIYRRSEIGATMDINIMSVTTESDPKFTDNPTKVACNNFGYVGSLNLGRNSALRYFNWGVSYNRIAQFDRRMSGYNPNQGGSLTNYIANFTSQAGFTENEMNFGENYNPYLDGSADWLSILAYNSYLINPVAGADNRYQGMYHSGTTADAQLNVREKGYVDKYTINFGGNFSDMVYWGIGIGVTDLSYSRAVTYSESMENASAYTGATGLIDNANAGYYLNNYKHMSGNGWDLSFGLIFKPVNELRIGAAIHTPTYWSIDQSYDANVDYSYLDPTVVPNDPYKPEKPEATDVASFSWRLKSPWKFMVGVAGVIGNSAIISLDYERQAYNDMTISNANYDSYGYIDGYDKNDAMSNDIRNYYRAANIIRAGIEYRVTPAFSLRAGYSHKTSMVKDQAADDEIEIVTAGTDPSYEFTKNTDNVSFGLGYRVGAFTIDATYMHTTRKSTMHAYTAYNGMPSNALPPAWNINQKNNHIVLSLAYHF